MSAAYFCELCGGSVDVDGVPDGVGFDSARYACATCLPIAALALSPARMRVVAEMVWGAYLDGREPRR